jgi:hypothetical protein
MLVTLLRGDEEEMVYPRWYSDIFWDYLDPTMDEEMFIDRYRARVQEDTLKAKALYKALSGGREVLVKDFKRTFERDFHEAPLANNVVVTRLSNARGMEFDKVYLVCGDLNDDIETISGAKAWYMAASRAKKRVITVTEGALGGNFATDDEGRVYDDNHLSMGHRKDTAPEGFLGEDALSRQAYIASEVSAFDELSIALIDGSYQLLHHGTSIGVISEVLTSRFGNANVHISDLFVTDVVSVLSDDSEAYDIHPVFKGSGVWLGVKFIGLGRRF